MKNPVVTIDVVSDVICPWCFLGQRRLEQALSSLQDIEVNVQWRPYQLDPDIPQEGVDRNAYMVNKFGDAKRVREAHTRLEALGPDAGIDFNFDAIQTTPNTIDAHRVIRWAGGLSETIQNTLVKRLFSLFFEQGKDIGDHNILVQAAQDAGMDANMVESMLASETDRQAVLDEAATASRMGVTGVPCFILQNRYAVMGAQEASVLVDAIRQVATEASQPPAPANQNIAG